MKIDRLLEKLRKVLEDIRINEDTLRQIQDKLSG
jgi:hypothetical protein